MIMNKIIVITGAEGEIGGFLFSFFKEDKYPVITLDEFITSKPRNAKVRLLHLAALADDRDCNLLIDSNINYLNKIIFYAEEFNIPEIIFFSSVSVYGDRNKEDLDEQDALEDPNIYGVTKLLGEKLLEKTGAMTLCLRLPAVLEMRRATNFFGRTFDNLQENKKVILANANRIFNNLISIEDIYNFVKKVKLFRKHDIINLGCEKKYTLLEIINFLKECLDSGSVIETAAGKKNFFNISIEKAVQDYQFSPEDARETLKKWCGERLGYKGSVSG